MKAKEIRLYTKDNKIKAALVVLMVSVILFALGYYVGKDLYHIFN